MRVNLSGPLPWGWNDEIEKSEIMFRDAMTENDAFDGERARTSV